MIPSTPLVSVITPVYNGEKYLGRCIDSILAQTYPNWEYTIVDNCSTDQSRQIANEYASRDARITVRSTGTFQEVIDSHNVAFRSISPISSYCKLVSADDWLYPECIARLVDLAERHGNVGVVGSYAINANGVRWTRLPYEQEVFSGSDICRRFLLDEFDVFWVPSSVLYRSAMVRAEPAFYPGSATSADLSACLRCLKNSDFGFVHQILSFERVHAESVTSERRKIDSYLIDRIAVLDEFAPPYLDPRDHQRRREELLSEYYHNVLAVAAVNLRPGSFWRFHRERLERLGYPLDSVRLAFAVFAKVCDLVLNPKQTAERLLRRFKG